MLKQGVVLGKSVLVKLGPVGWMAMLLLLAVGGTSAVGLEGAGRVSA
jgi:hypothetical protein